MIELYYDGEVIDKWSNHQCSWNNQLVFVNIEDGGERIKFLLTIGTLGTINELTHDCAETNQMENCIVKKDDVEHQVKAILFNKGDTIILLLENKEK